MYKKIHLQLTLLCAGITVSIMIVMSLCYLYISEKNLYENQYQSFKNDINTITSNLEQQYIVSMEWLAKMEAQGNYTFFALDNNIPFLYNNISNAANDARKRLMQESLEAYQNMFSLQALEEKIPISPYVSYHTEYLFSSPSTGEDYYSSVINIKKNSSLLQIIVLSSLKLLEKQILSQRIRFLVIDLTAIFLLFLFSFIFTGKLLKPIMESQQKQNQFIASASHELRTPLSVILSSVECCSNRDFDQQEKFIKIIRQESLRMSSLINDMLTLTSSDNHRFSIRKKETELDTLLMNIYESFEPLAKEKSLFLSMELPENILPLCCCDPDRIIQAVSILLHNAISYTPENGKIYLSLCYKKGAFEKGNFVISVKDNGIGISKKDKEKIFDRFYRAEKSRSAKGHFGLGLSIASEIVNAHQGGILVKDAPGGGSIFIITLPDQ